MTIADRARNQAISLEAKKDRLVQLQSNDWKVTFTVQTIDMDARLTQAPMGTRYAMVLVEIGDDEQPINRREAMPDTQQSKSAARPEPSSPARAKRDWKDLPPPQQAGIRINEPTFAAYLREEHSDEWHETGDADACLKMICRIESKTELTTSPKRLVLWHQLDSGYQAWLAKERVGA